MKVLVFDPAGSSEDYNLELIKGISKHIFPIYSSSKKPIKLSSNTEFKQFMTIKKKDYKNRALNLFNNLFRLIVYPISLLDLILFSLRNKINIIHYQWSQLPILDYFFISILKFFKIRTVMTIHNSNPYHGSIGVLQKIQLIGLANLIRKFDTLIVHTKKTKINIEKKHKLGEKKIYIINHGLFGSNNLTSNDFKISSKIKFLTIGSISYYKGIDIALNAFSQISRSNWSFTIAGRVNSSEYLHDLNEIINKNDLSANTKIIQKFLSRKEMFEMINSHDLMLLPYRDIDQSGIFMMSMGMNIPCACSDIGIFSEVIKNQENGFLFESESVSQLKNLIEDLVENPKKIESSKENFLVNKLNWPSWHQIAEETISVYKSLK
tara:strand:+ start:2045 stop:3181 length:1137 start_codon:yes stop_codon:yes gene_type:complete